MDAQGSQAARGPSDPPLDGWYHTIELGPGLTTHGVYDHRPVLERFEIPENLAGKRALDVGTADGFFAFELERRGAAEVVALDITSWSAVDSLPGIDLSTRPWSGREHFDIAHAALNSSVQFVEGNVYELSPAVAGIFDVVFCGSLLLHLMNPLRALTGIRSVTRELAIIETTHDRELEARAPDIPALRFGARELESSAGLRLGDGCHYWWMNRTAVTEMMIYAGFASVTAGEPFGLPPIDHPVIVAHGRP